ncbi:MAG: DUF3417 domain-containing protein, partial [Alloprevotella sp.]|nr:DUF3417 domain-containing protein [Alloprevotella sp.]
WKELVAERWDDITVVNTERWDISDSQQLVSGQEFCVRHTVDERGLEDAIGIDLVLVSNTDGQDHLERVIPMNVVKREGNLYTFEVKTSIDMAGSYKAAFRMYPKSHLLPHRQDFCYVRWFN